MAKHPFEAKPPHKTIRVGGGLEMQPGIGGVAARAARAVNPVQGDPRRFVEDGVGLIIHRKGKPDEVTK